jgi:hypothetical protein
MIPRSRTLFSRSGKGIASRCVNRLARVCSQIEAQGLAASLQSLAVEHKLYAAELRTMSAQLAASGAAAKSRAAANLNATNGLNSLMQEKAKASSMSLSKQNPCEGYLHGYLEEDGQAPPLAWSSCWHWNVTMS